MTHTQRGPRGGKNQNQNQRQGQGQQASKRSSQLFNNFANSSEGSCRRDRTKSFIIDALAGRKFRPPGNGRSFFSKSLHINKFHPLKARGKDKETLPAKEGSSISACQAPGHSLFTTLIPAQ